MPNPCRFCRATNRQITNEHVWPEWLADYMPKFKQHGNSERWSSAAGRQRWRQPILRATVRVFCDNCNSGWMSQLEDAAKPIVGPMVTGQPVELDTGAQRIVANWVALKGLVAVQTSQTEQPVPERHYRRVYAAKGAPANTMRVWIGQRKNLADPDRLGHARLFDSHFMPVTNAFPQFPMSPDIARYISEGGVFNATVLQVGHFFALAIQHDWPGLQARPTPRSDADRAFVPIWPIGPNVRWPPPRPVDVLGDAHKMTQFFQMAPPVVPVVGP